MEQTSLFVKPRPDRIIAPAVAGDVDGLRDYQRHRADQCVQLLSAFRSCVKVMHCGAGKTITAGAIVKHWPGRVLWLAHRDFLCYQARVTLSKITCSYVDLEKAAWYSGDSRVIVGSVQTLKGDRLKRHARDKFSLIVIDEGHHGVSKSWSAIPDWFETAKLLYLTATPKRNDKLGLWNVANSHCDPWGIDEGLEWGSFVPFIPVSEFIDTIDLSSVKTTAGDLANNELELQIVKSAASIAQLTAKHMEDRPTIIYTPGVASAHAVAATLREMGFTAVSVDADTDSQIRDQVLKDFNSGKVQYVVNCAIYTEGLDVPNARGIVIARPTKSESLYTQMAGRGGRPEGWIGNLVSSHERRNAIAASGKPNFKLLDITGHAGRHSITCAIDLLGGRRVKEAVEKVKKQVAAGKGKGTASEMLDEAEKNIKEQEQENRSRIAAAAAAANVISRQSTFDPLVRLGFDERNHGEEPANPSSPADARQVEWLKKNKLPWKNATRGMAQKLYNQAKIWQRDGMATWRQRKELSKYISNVNIPFAVASQCMAHVVESGFRPDTMKLEGILNADRSGKEIPRDHAANS